jgi:hypothetical protein
MGFSYITGVNPTDTDLMNAVEGFPNLNSIDFDITWSVTQPGIQSVARAMGEHLLEMKISALMIGTSHYLSNATMVVIGECCKNLKSFTYQLDGSHYERHHDLLTNSGIISLARKCHQLQYLNLKISKKVTKEAFVTILDMLDQSNAASSRDTYRNEGYALRTIDLTGFGFWIAGNPLRIVKYNTSNENQFAQYYASAT